MPYASAEFHEIVRDLQEFGDTVQVKDSNECDRLLQETTTKLFLFIGKNELRGPVLLSLMCVDSLRAGKRSAGTGADHFAMCVRRAMPSKNQHVFIVVFSEEQTRIMVNAMENLAEGNEVQLVCARDSEGR